MPPYQAQRQGLYGVGSPAFIRPQINVGETIDALAGAGNSYIHQAFLRRQAENEMALRQGEFALSQKREAREAAAQQQTLDIQRQDSATRRAMAGYTEPSVNVAPPAPSTPAPMPTPNEPAMISGLPAQGGNSPLTKPVDLTAQSGPLTKLEFTPGGYDASKSLRGALLGLRGQQVDEEIDRRAAASAATRASIAGATHGYRMQEIGARGAQSRQTKSVGSAQPKPLNAAQQLKYLNGQADNIVQNAGGDVSAVQDFLNNDPEGAKLRGEGLTYTHIGAALDRYGTKQQAGARSLLGSGMATSPEDAAAKNAAVKPARVPLGPKRPAAASSASPLKPKYDAEAKTYQGAVSRITTGITDPDQRKQALAQAATIYNGRVAKIAAGQDPDTPPE